MKMDMTLFKSTEQKLLTSSCTKTKQKVLLRKKPCRFKAEIEEVKIETPKIYCECYYQNNSRKSMGLDQLTHQAHESSC